MSPLFEQSSIVLALCVPTIPPMRVTCSLSELTAALLAQPVTFAPLYVCPAMPPMQR